MNLDSYRLTEVVYDACLTSFQNMRRIIRLRRGLSKLRIMHVHGVPRPMNANLSMLIQLVG
jgi:hypothetical protein